MLRHFQWASLFPRRLFQSCWAVPLLGLLLLSAGEGGIDAPPQIASLSPPTLEKSGLLILTGSGFGANAAGGSVWIDGQPAIATTWSDTEIHAYVPEAADLGAVSIQVVNAAGGSNAMTLTVRGRQAQDRVKWRFQVDDLTIGRFIATGSDGTVYVSDRWRLYALTAGGALKWTLENAGATRPISLGPDGTIYTGFDGVQAIDPSGTLLWDFRQPGGISILAGPNLGPDGALYVVAEAFDGGPGAFSLDLNGNLRWSDPGDPILVSNVILNNSLLAFREDGFYVGYDPFGGLPTLRAFDLSGNQLWTVSETGQTAGTLPRSDPSGRAVTGWGVTGIMALTADAQVDWIRLHPNGTSAISMPVIDSNGVIYTGDWLGVELWALDRDGNTLWVQPKGQDLLDSIGLTPDESLILTAENGGFGFEVPAWVRAYRTSDGAFQWQVEIGPERGFNQGVWSREPGFSPDGGTAYVTTLFAGNGGAGYLYAIDLATSVPFCQTDIGFGGPGAATLNVCGQPLLSGNVASLRLEHAPPNAPAFLAYGLNSNPVPAAGGLLVPNPWLRVVALTTDAQGTLTLPNVPGGNGPRSGYAQCAVLDAGQPGRFQISNTIQLDFLP